MSPWATWTGLAAHGRARAEHFSWEQVAQRVLAYYERLAYEKQNARDRHDAGALEVS